MAPTEEVLFYLGSLTVYTIRYNSSNDPIQDFYWRDANLIGEYGPFVSLYQAMDQYRNVMKVIKERTTTNNVVKVNFVTKKRLV